jgi:hypothetical protein
MLNQNLAACGNLNTQMNKTYKIMGTEDTTPLSDEGY